MAVHSSRSHAAVPANRTHRRLVGRVVALAVALTAIGVPAIASAPRGETRTAKIAQAAGANGGTAYFAEQPLSPPNYIFPLISDENYSVENTSDFQTLLYRPLYWFGDAGHTSIDYPLSIGNTPRYADHDRIVKISLKRTFWSNGEQVSARDVEFWINLVKANSADWASYVPGGFPDNIASMTVLSPTTIELHLTASFNPTWFTDNELSQITPLPIAWDRTSPTVSSSSGSVLPDQSKRGAQAVYAFLNGQARQLGSYATSPIWSVVDGPWRLSSLTSDGTAIFVPNGRYDGPHRARLARFIEVPFTSESAEFSLLEAGPATSSSAGGEQISVGYVPDTDVPQGGALHARGYQLLTWYPFQFDYFEPNFNNSTVGPILRQLYFRQAFQHLVDERGWIHAYYGGIGVTTYGPIPASPRNPYADGVESSDPYPFDIAAARHLLATHGWHISVSGTTTCADPGTGATECGAGIARNEPLTFTVVYPSGLDFTDGSMIDLQSVAREVGINLQLHEVTMATVESTVAPCTPSQAACGWELGQFGSGWLFEPDHYPSGEEIFETGAIANVGNFSDPLIDRLIAATTTAAPRKSKEALDSYQNAVRLDLPDFWQPSPGTLVTVQSDLRGVTLNAYGFISPEEWYFTGG